jgi:molecular chaperone DnaK
MDLDRVVLVGGMTRMPAVRRLARQITGIEPYGHVDPDKVVALGAAIQAGVLAGQVRKVTLVDVTPLSLGIETQGGLFARVIARNTPVPTRNSRLFTNARDDQTVMEVHVLQGEREMAADNMALGEFDLVGITPQVRGEAKVEVVFDIDANGIIHVSATDLQTDTSRRIRVEAAVRPSEETVGRLLADSRTAMEADRRKREEIEAAILAENLIRAAEQLIDEASRIAHAQAPATQPLQEAAETAVSAVRDALAGGETEIIVVAGKALEASLKKLSAAVKPAVICIGARGRAA